MFRGPKGLAAEPSIRDLMDDPLTHAVMRRDALTAEDVWTVIRQAQRVLAARQRHPWGPCQPSVIVDTSAQTGSLS